MRGTTTERAAQLVREILGPGEPIPWLLGHRPGKRRLQRRQLGPAFPDRRRRRHHMFGDDSRRTGVIVGLRPGEQVKSGARQCILISSRVDRLTHQLLGRGIGNRPDGDVGRGQSRVVDTARDPEVGQKHPLRLQPRVSDQDVGRFDVPMQQPTLVGVVQGGRHRGDDRHRHADRHPLRIVLAQQFRGIGATDEVDGDPKLIARLTPVVDAQNVRMGQVRRDVGFTQEPGPVLRIGGQVGREHLQRVLTRQPRMLNEVHRAHRAGTEHPNDGVSRKLLADRKRHGQIVGRYLSKFVDSPQSREAGPLRRNDRSANSATRKSRRPKPATIAHFSSSGGPREAGHCDWERHTLKAEAPS